MALSGTVLPSPVLLPSRPGSPPRGAAPAYTPARPATGALAYGLGFLAYLPIPLVNFVVAGVTMAAVYPSQRRKSPLAAENARRAANWGLTLLTIVGVIVLSTVLLVTVLEPSERGEWPLIPLVLIVPTGIAHLVTIVMGLVRANKGLVYANPLAIPFLRP